MNSFEATAHVVTQLEDHRIPYMLVGALSSNAYGIPRATKDADIVVSFDSMGVVEFAKQLGDGFELDRRMRMETITNSIRNIITYRPTNFDIELFRLSQDEHHKERFARRQRRWLSEINREACIPTAEDVVIQKLRWKRRKDLDDAQNVLAVRAKKLDWDYLTHWTKIHGTFDLLNQLRAECPNLDLIDDELGSEKCTAKVYMAQVTETRIEVLLPEVVRALRSRTQRERIQMAYDSNRLVRERLRTHLKFAHPNWSQDQIEREIAKRLLHGTS